MPSLRLTGEDAAAAAAAMSPDAAALVSASASIAGGGGDGGGSGALVSVVSGSGASPGSLSAHMVSLAHPEFRISLSSSLDIDIRLPYRTEVVYSVGWLVC